LKNHFNAECIVDLSKVKDLKYITEENDCIHIGAGTTFATIASHPAIRSKVAALAQAAEQIGSVQIRNRATIGGNIASASPAGDCLPVLAAFDARIMLVGLNGTRTMTVKEAVADICQSSLQEKEIIKEIAFPLNGRRLSAFGKIGHRSAVTIARLNMAILLDYCRQDDSIVTGTVALGSLGAVPVCPQSVAEFLCDRKVDRTFASRLAGLLSEVVNKEIPDRESRPYKAAAVKGLAFDIVTGLFGDRFDL
jgi:xanthine dehydrogenase FAD-binding subunit